MKDRGFQRHVTISALFSILLAVTVIAVAGYYDTPLLLLSQLLVIAGPTLGAFLPLPRVGRSALLSWLLIAALVGIGWGYVAYVDSRPYQGGGASFAPLLGWFTCVVAALVAAAIRLLHRRLNR